MVCQNNRYAGCHYHPHHKGIDMLELLDKYWMISFVIIGIAFFIAWCLGKAAKDPYIDDHEEMFEKDLPPILKKQAD